VAYHSERRKRIRVNETDVRRLSELFGFLTAVIFSPEDLQLVKGGPAHRRRFLDLELAQIDPGYRRDLIDYQQVLVQRNNLLRQGLVRSGRPQPAGPGELAAWDEELVALGSRVQAKRARAVAALSELAGEAHRQVTAGREALRLTYLAACGEGAARIEVTPSGDWTADRFRDRLAAELVEVAPVERRRGMTLLGPHRDDLALAVNGTDARAYGSQGQQRTAALALKLGELEYMRQATGEYPVLLLDDVMSELDEGRRRFLLSVAGEKTQVFVTATTTRSLPAEHVAAATLFVVEQGRISFGGEILSEARPEETGAH
jgi:DNA replication and repair protein RecF